MAFTFKTFRRLSYADRLQSETLKYMYYNFSEYRNRNIRNNKQMVEIYRPLCIYIVLSVMCYLTCEQHCRSDLKQKNHVREV